MSRLSVTPFGYASMVLALVALVAILKFNLLVAMLSACSTYALAKSLPATWPFHKAGSRAPAFATMAVAAIPLVLLVAAIAGATYLGNHASDAYAQVVAEIGHIIEQWRGKLPAALAQHLPQGQETLLPWLTDLVKSQAEHLTSFGKSSAHGLLMAVVGVVIGLLIANSSVEERAPLAAAIAERTRVLQDTFSSIVVAQFWIACINTALTAIFFYAIVPLLGMSMPYAGSLLILTFIAGMLPVVGNLVCNTVTTIVALSVGPVVAVSALVFLILVHKLEYIVNAKVVGRRMSMAAWELLAAMFVCEAAFGIPGLVSAPFFYAYLKRELRELGWV
jgi:predicted PurR-regulated permease PerM